MDPSISQSDFRAFLRNALRDPAQISLVANPLYSTEDEGSSAGSSDRFKKLIDGIHFSKRFILSYQLILIAVIVMFTVVHWISRLQAWRRRRHLSTLEEQSERQAKDGEGLDGGGGSARSIGSSSGSSTLGGDATPSNTKSQGLDEHTPLLPKLQSTQPTMSLEAINLKVKAWLIYQPRPIPVVNKTLPSNGASLVLTAFIGLQIFYALFMVPMSLSMLFVFADRTSLLFVANLPLLYLFAAKNQPLKLLTGYSYESLNIFHRRLGEVMCLLALLHSLGMIGVWYMILRPVGITFVKFMLMRIILLGTGAFVAYELIYFTSLGSFRQRWYELFLGLHVVLQAAALILVWFHHHGSRPYVGAALAIFLIDRVLYRLSVKRTTVLASLEVKDDKKTVALCVSTLLTGRRSLASYLCGAGNINRGWKATEHVFLTIPSLAHKHTIQAHPFTIASRAPVSKEGGAKLELLIRGQDGFSLDLVRYAYTHDFVTAQLDGPYGSQTAVNMLHDSNHAIIVAGGSGIAVTWPLVWSMLEELRMEDPENLATSHAKSIFFVWVIRDQSHIMWLGEEKLKELEARGVTLEIPPPTAENGHPDIERIIMDWVASLGDRNIHKHRIGVVASGPDGLNRSVRNTCSTLVAQGHDVEVEVEKFGW